MEVDLNIPSKLRFVSASSAAAMAYRLLSVARLSLSSCSAVLGGVNRPMPPVLLNGVTGPLLPVMLDGEARLRAEKCVNMPRLFFL